MTGLLDGKVAMVTGAGHGIGRGHALELAKHGATVIINDLGTTLDGTGTGKVADEVVQIIESRGGSAISDFSDIGDEEQVDLAVERAYSQCGRLDIVVNNAGIVRDKAIWNMTVDDFDLVMRVHVRGSWLTSRAVARKWRAEYRASMHDEWNGRLNPITRGLETPTKNGLVQSGTDTHRTTGSVSSAT